MRALLASYIVRGQAVYEKKPSIEKVAPHNLRRICARICRDARGGELDGFNSAYAVYRAAGHNGRGNNTGRPSLLCNQCPCAEKADHKR